MVRRLASSLVYATVALLVWALPALAGGWAITSFDPLPSEFRAGETYRLGYTIRQHGKDPFVGARSAVRIWSPTSGESHRFSAVAEGEPGHYVVEVRFPSAGAWRWEVDQNPFAAQDLGAITVLPPSPVIPRPNAVVEAAAEAPPLRADLVWWGPTVLAAVLVTLALGGWTLALVARRRGASVRPSLR